MKTTRPVVRLALLLSALSSALSPALSAQEPGAAPVARPAAIRADQSGLVLPAGRIDADELVHAVATFLGRNIDWAPKEHGKVPVEPFVLQRPLALDALGSEEVLSQMLWSRGFALVPVHADKGLYQVLLVSQRGKDIASAALVRTPTEIARQPHLRVFVRTVVDVKVGNATVLAGLLQRTFGQGSNPQLQIATDKSLRQLLIAGFQDDVAQALRLLLDLDREPAAAVKDEPAPARGGVSADRSARARTATAAR